jgi:uncharacterized protein YbjT (DUF2867 family)
MKVIIFGATGLIGSYLTDICLNDSSVTEVVVFVRKPTGRNNMKLKEVVLNFEQLTDNQQYIKGEVVFNCLGTTLKQAGSQAAQAVIDRDYPIQIAQIAAKNAIPLMVSVSSVGSDVSASNFYLKTKGEMEAGVSAAIGKGAYFLQPSILTGDRKEFRLGEKIGIFAMNFFDLLMFGGLKKYHSIHGKNVAKAMLNLAKKGKTNSQVLHYEEIMKFAR